MLSEYEAQLLRKCNHGATPTRLTNTGTSTRGPMTAAAYEVERVSGAGRDFAC